MFNRVAIIGLGLIGGSLGLALRQARAARQVAGFDLFKGVGDRARKLGAIDQSCTSLADAVRGSELIILATPVGAMRPLLQQLATSASPGAVVTDVASTKAQVISWAEEYLPATISFVGGHPIAGKETSGIEAADATLFKQCVYCLTPTKRTSPAALERVAALIDALGARMRFLEPPEHDGMMAGVSHLPFIASIALMQTAALSPAWDDASILAGSGFRDMTRLAAGSPEMYRDICLTNSETITRWLADYITVLSTLRERIAAHDVNLGEVFAQAQKARNNWQDAQERAKDSDPK
jgi:prephenate dehydrogenase